MKPHWLTLSMIREYHKFEVDNNYFRGNLDQYIGEFKKRLEMLGCKLYFIVDD